MSGGLQGRVALVTGASRGIGRAIAVSMAKAGADVALVARTEEALQETRGLVEAEGRRALPLALDVSDPDRVAAAVKQVAKELGGLDILVNNAGLTRDGLLMRMSDADWDEVLTVNLRGVFAFCRAAMRPLMKSSAGRIVNISSIVGLMGNAGQVNYSAAKAGLIGLTKSLAKEVAGRGVTANVVCPGWIETDMTAGLGDEIRDASLTRIPLNRFGEVGDIAETVSFLCSDAAGYITGVVLPVDGGWSMG